jgi:hypothetical protein
MLNIIYLSFWFDYNSSKSKNCFFQMTLLSCLNNTYLWSAFKCLISSLTFSVFTIK